ncbi:hypothetical protein BDA96_03G192500 [Sorghum bicolor]|uniref:Uncharacterized protein n=2 Tax=Sorghum bicolor TaxID=4558 RepID=A0A1W0VTA7_SORBI|nr:uncharacterized protein LOC8058870 isoform X2 [Sorghum bicolor]KAG0537945.1 hypothetical protein BDA96_03G192500 [Sorghum bicolor]OQU76509.1 hypothetical protein SORBI_3010G158000 [Sorghum bicolor]OQU76512.1 hypothetical protein SORBI_3010G158000 [Sorghum bicolor]|eukprot:XP_021304716.1 uncharacterized protein LOC8058870 isoform X2 [Sorghum bicolor]
MANSALPRSTLHRVGPVSCGLSHVSNASVQHLDVVAPTPPPQGHTTTGRSPPLESSLQQHRDSPSAGRRDHDDGRRLASLRRRGLLPASLSLTLLLATLVPPSPFPPNPAPPSLLPPRRGAHAISPCCARVSILVLSAAAVFFDHIRKIGCMHSLERSTILDAFFEDPNSLKKVPTCRHFNFLLMDERWKRSLVHNK